MKEVTFGKAMALKYPEWLVQIVAVDDLGRVNTMPAGWAMIASGKPPMFAVAVGRSNYTHELIEQSQEFIIAFPSPGQEKDVLYTGTHSGRDIDKMANTGFESVPATRVRPPLLKGCIVNLECKLANQTPAGDHTIFVGEVVASHIEEGVGKRLVNFGDDHFAAATPVDA